jgi:hypothetical protein
MFDITHLISIKGHGIHHKVVGKISCPECEIIKKNLLNFVVLIIYVLFQGGLH